MSDSERLRRWRLVLGADACAEKALGALSATDRAMDSALEALYGASSKGESRKGGLGASAPNVARWLGDIRRYFPTDRKSVV